MEWKNKLLDKCNSFNLEVAEDKEKLVFICPKMPKETTKKELIKILPKNQSYEFIEGIKQSTTIKLKAVSMRFGIYSINVDGKKDITLTVNSTQAAEVVEKIFEALDGIFRADGYFKSWRIKINDEEKYYFPTIDIQANTERDCSISEDDILNLIIMLNTNTSVEEFINNM